jgi:transcriptional regulator with XRE-family HTH domain
MSIRNAPYRGNESINPFLAVRLSFGLSQVEFSRAIGVAMATVEQAEQGISANPRSMYLALGKLGYNADILAEEYTTWRGQKNSIAKAKLATTMAPTAAGAEARNE